MNRLFARILTTFLSISPISGMADNLGVQLHLGGAEHSGANASDHASSLIINRVIDRHRWSVGFTNLDTDLEITELTYGQNLFAAGSVTLYAYGGLGAWATPLESGRTPLLALGVEWPFAVTRAEVGSPVVHYQWTLVGEVLQYTDILDINSKNEINAARIGVMVSY